MKKIADTAFTVFLLVAAAALWLLGGKDYLPMWLGSKPMPDGGLGSQFLCLLTAAASLILFVCRLIASRAGEGKKEESLNDAPAGMHRFLSKQSIWVKEWCRSARVRDDLGLYLWVIGITLSLVIIGILAEYPFLRVMTFHFPLGLLLGDLIYAIGWPINSYKYNWKNIIKRIESIVVKQIQSPEVRADYFEDYFETNGQWDIVEKGKSCIKHVTVGAKFWTYISEDGFTNIVYPPQVDHIETYEEIITVRVNRVRTRTRHYLADFWGKNTDPKKNKPQLITRYSFESRDSLDAFVKFVRLRTNGQLAITDVGTKHL